MWLCRFLLLFVLHLISADAENGRQILNRSQGKVYMYFKKTSTPEEALKICKANNMNLLSVEQRAEKNWVEKIIGKFFRRVADGTISAFVCEKNDVSRINNFTRYAAFPFTVKEISSMMGNRMECAVHCSDILPCDIFTYASNACRFYSKDNGSKSKPSCDRLQCYVKRLGP